MRNKLHFPIALLIVFVAFLSANSQIYTGKAITSCVDSDSGDLYVKGTVNIEGEKLTDYCEADALVEYYCENKDLRVQVYPCPNSCDDGACNRYPTTSSGTPIKQSLHLGTISDQIEIGEFIGDVRETITEYETDALKGGLISTKSGATEYSQYLRFKTTGVLDGRVLFAENEDDDIGDYLVFDEANYAFEYELQFDNGLESEIDGKDLADLENENVFILDREFTIVDARLSGTQVTLQLVSGDLPSKIEEGETKQYQLQNGILEIEVINVDDTNKETSLVINGQTRTKLEEGEIVIVDGVIVGVDNIFLNEVGEGKDFITLFVGAERIEFEDGDYTDSDFSQGIKINGDSISDGYVQIKGVKNNDDFEILSLKYRLKPDAYSGNKVYIPPEKGMKEFLKDPAAMLANWDILYHGLTSKNDVSILKIDPSSNDEYHLEFENVKGEFYNIPYVANVAGSLQMGDDSNSLHFIEGSSNTDFTIDSNDYIVLTNRNTKSGITNIARYSSIDTSAKTLHFDEIAEGSKTVTYSGTEGTNAVGDLIVAGNTYRVHIGPSPDYKLAMDLTSDSDVASDEANIIIKGGGILDLGTNHTPGSSFNATLTTEASQFDSSSNNEVITVEILNKGNEVDLNIPTQTGVTIESASGKNLALSNYGAFLTQDKDDPDELKVEYPLSQAFADIELAFFETPTSTIEILPTPQPPTQPPTTPAPVTPPPLVTEAPSKAPPTITYVEKEPWWKNIWKTIANWLL